ncbi:hypothetical protein [Deminuibacter soli]|uniref:Uncharacterized protein n=1 Tax=Deminuibacter soli TaxID=2291815 RepID=A0A3E1NCD5_9BACT|nr:hypothetical protein [Deminuibacter soli]RFM25646.1 hypothetical protein DXN05_23850 [Deminuibacter soli]
MSFVKNAEFVNYQYFSFSSLNFRKERFQEKDGHISFYATDNVDEKCSRVIESANKLYMPVVQRFLDADIALVDDIVDYSFNYGYPLIFALISYYLNNQEAAVPDLLKKAKEKKLPLVSPRLMNRIPELQKEEVKLDYVLDKLKHYFVSA